MTNAFLLFYPASLLKRIAAAGAILCLALPASAHEFWLETTDYHPPVTAAVPISIHVGQFFKGNSFPYLGDEFVRFAVHAGGKTADIKGMNGDMPAANIALLTPGLAAVTYHSHPFDLTFKEWKKFEAYIHQEGLSGVLARHAKGDKPRTEIKELYERDAKLLIDAGGGGKGQDGLTGLPLELVAEHNPYRLKAGNPLPVRLYFRGTPLPDVQITAFSRADPKHPKKYRTDSSGRAEVPLPLPGPWLLNAVHMVEPAKDQDAHWYSYWASLVFFRP
jgi:uncharacterized GH25 family protein